MNKHSATLLMQMSAALLCSVLMCCSVSTLRLPDKTLSIVTYNTQTFFDAVQDGTEFPAFKGSKSLWTETKYRSRLKRLKETVLQLNEKLGGQKNTVPDILVLQEIENERVVEDFCKQLSADETYPYALSCPKTGSEAFNSAVLSKYPIISYQLHYLTGENRHFLRPVIEAVIETGTQKKPQPVRILAVHWKSKAGTNGGSESRKRQEEQLCSLLHKQQELRNMPYIVCGDFNQPLSEFSCLQNESVCWFFPEYCEQAAKNTQPEGSYFFKNCWEKIDHIFYSTKDSGSRITLCSFHVLHEPPITENGIPFRFDVAKGTGYSDHLPLGAVFRFNY